MYLVTPVACTSSARRVGERLGVARRRLPAKVACGAATTAASGLWRCKRHAPMCRNKADAASAAGCARPLAPLTGSRGLTAVQPLAAAGRVSTSAGAGIGRRIDGDVGRMLERGLRETLCRMMRQRGAAMWTRNDDSVCRRLGVNMVSAIQATTRKPAAAQNNWVGKHDCG